MECIICENPDRDLIEQDVFDHPDKVEEIALKYQVSVDDLLYHMLRHTSDNVRTGLSQDSIARNIKKREADMLAEVADGYMRTFTDVCNQMSSAACSSDATSFNRALTKPAVDLYLGLGKEIRETVTAIAELDQILNGPKDQGKSGLQALADAISGSVASRAGGSSE